jgi:hypothetical protein
MPAASVTRFRRVAGTGLYHVHLAFAQVRLVQSASSLTHVASPPGLVSSQRPPAFYQSRPSWPASAEEY